MIDSFDFHESVENSHFHEKLKNFLSELLVITTILRFLQSFDEPHGLHTSSVSILTSSKYYKVF